MNSNVKVLKGFYCLFFLTTATVHLTEPEELFIVTYASENFYQHNVAPDRRPIIILCPALLAERKHQVQDRIGGWRKIFKNVTPFPMFWFRHSRLLQQAVTRVDVIAFYCHGGFFFGGGGIGQSAQCNV